MTNTRVVDAGLSNSEIQKIIDNAKVNNVILFKGSSYSNINIVITKSLTLLSKVNTVLKSSSGPVISIKGKEASLTTVKGFNIQSAGNGVVVNNADYITIVSNDISSKGNGIVATGTKYLNITKNNVVKNSKSGISIADSSYVYIFNNKVSNNEEDGIVVQNAGDNINIKSNSITSNKGNGISLAHIGDNVIQSNVITDNWRNGIKFFDNYAKPKNQDISYNAIYFNIRMDVEAKETYYQETGSKLEIGDNWYTDHAGICSKINSYNILCCKTSRT